MAKLDQEHEAQLPGTLKFVLMMLACYFVAWFLLYALLGNRS